VTFGDSTDDHSIRDKAIAKIALCFRLVLSFLFCLSLFSSPFFVIGSQGLTNGCPRDCVSFPGLALEPARLPAQWVTKTVTQGENGPDHDADHSTHVVPTIGMIGALPSLPHMSALRAQEPLNFFFSFPASCKIIVTSFFLFFG
jgi:hypothetical protein